MRRRELLVIIAVVAVSLAVVLEAYCWRAWERSRSSKFDAERYHALRQIVQALMEYRSEWGAWPTDLERLRAWDAALPDVPVAGPDRVEIIRLGSGKVVVRSYGHTESAPGWNLRYDPVFWEMGIDEEWHEVRLRPK